MDWMLAIDGMEAERRADRQRRFEAEQAEAIRRASRR